jgi:hypothetical protein
MFGSEAIMTEPQKLASMGKNRISITLARYISIRRTARTLGVSHIALTRYIVSEGIKLPKKKPKRYVEMFPKHAKQASKAKFVKWIEAHPDVKLPRSIKKIVELTGLTADQVKVYLSHERRKLRIRLKAIPHLGAKELTFVDLDGNAIFLEPKMKYRFAVDHWSLNVYIVIDDHKCLIKDLDDFERRTQ